MFFVMLVLSFCGVTENFNNFVCNFLNQQKYVLQLHYLNFVQPLTPRPTIHFTHYSDNNIIVNGKPLLFSTGQTWSGCFSYWSSRSITETTGHAILGLFVYYFIYLFTKLIHLDIVEDYFIPSFWKSYICFNHK